MCVCELATRLLTLGGSVVIENSVKCVCVSWLPGCSQCKVCVCELVQVGGSVVIENSVKCVCVSWLPGCSLLEDLLLSRTV